MQADKRGSDHLCVCFTQCVHVGVKANLIMASILKQLAIRGKNTLASEAPSRPGPDSDSGPKEKLEADGGPDSEPGEKLEADGRQSCFDSLAAQPQSPSPEAEYDKLLVRGKITALPTCSSI